MGYWSQQTILVTGSSRGIGRELAINFSKLGAKVAIHYNSNEAKAKEVLALCDASHCAIYKADVGNEEEVTSMLKSIEENLGPISILVNNAGQTRDGLLLTMPTEDWHALMKTHLDGTFYCSRGVLRSMISNKFGRIINISSVSGVRGTAGQCNYSAAKAGIIGFSKALAKEVAKKRVTCNAVALGVIETDMTTVLPEETLNAYKKAIPSRRFGTTSEVAALIEYLAGPDSSYLTGQVITLDGGMI